MEISFSPSGRTVTVPDRPLYYFPCDTSGRCLGVDEETGNYCFGAAELANENDYWVGCCHFDCKVVCPASLFHGSVAIDESIVYCSIHCDQRVDPFEFQYKGETVSVEYGRSGDFINDLLSVLGTNLRICGIDSDDTLSGLIWLDEIIVEEVPLTIKDVQKLLPPNYNSYNVDTKNFESYLRLIPENLQPYMSYATVGKLTCVNLFDYKYLPLVDSQLKNLGTFYHLLQLIGELMDALPLVCLRGISLRDIVWNGSDRFMVLPGFASFDESSSIRSDASFNSLYMQILHKLFNQVFAREFKKFDEWKQLRVFIDNYMLGGSYSAKNHWKFMFFLRLHCGLAPEKDKLSVERMCNGKMRKSPLSHTSAEVRRMIEYLECERDEDGRLVKRQHVGEMEEMGAMGAMEGF